MSGTHKGYQKPAGAPVTRIGSGGTDEAMLQRAIAGTGCTVTECFTDSDGAKAVRFLYGDGDKPWLATAELKSLGYRVHIMTRKRP